MKIGIKDDAFELAKNAYTNSFYGATIVKLAEAIEAYLATPEPMRLEDSIKLQLNEISRENVALMTDLNKVRNALNDISNRAAQRGGDWAAETASKALEIPQIT